MKAREQVQTPPKEEDPLVNTKESAFVDADTSQAANVPISVDDGDDDDPMKPLGSLFTNISLDASQSTSVIFPADGNQVGSESNFLFSEMNLLLR